MRFLIIEQDNSCRKTLVSALSSLGDCDTASTRHQIMNKMVTAWEQEEAYDVVFLDAATAQEWISSIREQEKEYKVAPSERCTIIVTMDTDELESILGMLRQGSESYLIKPFDERMALERLNKLGLIEVGLIGHPTR